MRRDPTETPEKGTIFNHIINRVPSLWENMERKMRGEGERDLDI